MRARLAPKRVRYETATVTQRSIVARVTANGTLSARVTVQVGSQVSGRIQELLVDFNSRVRKGQVLARLDPALFRAAVDAARANLAAADGGLTRARARSSVAKLVLDRTQTLATRDLVAGAALDTAKADSIVGEGDVAAAQGGMAQARAALRQAEISLAYTTIRSPVDGVVISRSVDIGQTVAASLQAPTLFTIAEDLTKMQVQTNVPEADIGKLRAGLAATFTVDAFPDERFAGVVDMVRNASQVTQNVVTYSAVVDVDNAELRLRPGMTATVAFVVAEKSNVPAVPVSALRFQPRRRQSEPTPPAQGLGSHRTLYLLAAQRPRPVAVELGISDGIYSEVVAGALKAGDLVILEERSEEGGQQDKQQERDDREDKSRRLPRGL
jgi:HlyD family secretion protein